MLKTLEGTKLKTLEGRGETVTSNGVQNLEQTQGASYMYKLIAKRW